MPIRTNRGRVAVYRRLWGWPMRSPRHLLATVLLVAAFVLTIGLIVPKLTGANDKAPGAANTGGTTGTGQVSTPTGSGAGSGSGQGAGAPAQGSTAAPSTSLSTLRQTAPAQTPTPAPPAPQALDVATLWAKAWVNHPEGVSTEQWLNTLKPYTTEEQAAVMSTVDPRNIEATEVTGPPNVKVSYTASVEAVLPTNAGSLDITVINTPQGWRVAKYEQAA